MTRLGMLSCAGLACAVTLVYYNSMTSDDEFIQPNSDPDSGLVKERSVKVSPFASTDTERNKVDEMTEPAAQNINKRTTIVTGDSEMKNTSNFDRLRDEVLDCFDANKLALRQSPECQDAIKRIYDLAETTRNLAEMEFIISTLYTEIDAETLRTIIDGFEERTSDIAREDIFSLKFIGFSSSNRKDVLDVLYDDYFSMDAPSKERWLDSMIDISWLHLGNSASRAAAFEGASKLLADIEQTAANDNPGTKFQVSSSGVSMNGSGRSPLLQRYKLKAAVEGEISGVDMAVRDTVASKDPFLALQLYSEGHAACRSGYDPVVCEKIKQSSDLHGLLLSAELDQRYSEEDRSSFGEAARRQFVEL